jgi:hypothetical protein
VHAQQLEVAVVGGGKAGLAIGMRGSALIGFINDAEFVAEKIAEHQPKGASHA